MISSMITGSSKKWRISARRISALGVLAIAVWLGPVSDGRAQGKQIFQTHCAGCHSIGGGRLVGPDLAGIHAKRPQAWLERFVKSSQSMIKSGDADANAVFNEFNQFPMPDVAISDSQIREVLDYIKVTSAGAGTTGPSGVKAGEPPAEKVATATKEDIFKGQEMFQGKVRFEQGGPACNACHNVNYPDVIGQGILAKELTTVFSKMGGTGVRAILGSAPFPVMEAAYKNKALTDVEIFSLVAFLQDADRRKPQRPRDYGIGLFISGVIGAIVLFGFYSLLWLRRKKGSVNQAIYDRQVRSE